MPMFLIVIYMVVIVFISETDTVESQKISSGKYIDVFLPGLDGKKTLGSTKSTCWARGGICVHIRDCNSHKIDVGVSGCSWGFMVCCKVFNFGPPTVGLQRKSSDLKGVKDMEDLEGVSIEILAEKNTKLIRQLFGV